jgi:hypothetical protein
LAEAELRSANAALRAQVEQLRDQAESNVAQASAEVLRLHRGLEAAASDAQTAHGELSDRRRDVASLSAQLAHLEAIVAAETAEKEQLSTQLDSTSSEVAELQAQLSQANDGMEDLSRAQSDAEQRAEELEGQLGAILAAQRQCEAVDSLSQRIFERQTLYAWFDAAIISARRRRGVEILMPLCEAGLASSVIRYWFDAAAERSTVRAFEQARTAASLRRSLALMAFFTHSNRLAAEREARLRVSLAAGAFAAMRSFVSEQRRLREAADYDASRAARASLRAWRRATPPVQLRKQQAAAALEFDRLRTQSAALRALGGEAHRRAARVRVVALRRDTQLMREAVDIWTAAFQRLMRIRRLHARLAALRTKHTAVTAFDAWRQAYAGHLELREVSAAVDASACHRRTHEAFCQWHGATAYAVNLRAAAGLVTERSQQVLCSEVLANMRAEAAFAADLRRRYMLVAQARIRAVFTAWRVNVQREKLDTFKLAVAALLGVKADRAAALDVLRYWRDVAAAAILSRGKADAAVAERQQVLLRTAFNAMRSEARSNLQRTLREVSDTNDRLEAALAVHKARIAEADRDALRLVDDLHGATRNGAELAVERDEARAELVHLNAALDEAASLERSLRAQLEVADGRSAALEAQVARLQDQLAVRHDDLSAAAVDAHLTRQAYESKVANLQSRAATSEAALASAESRVAMLQRQSEVRVPVPSTRSPGFREAQRASQYLPPRPLSPLEAGGDPYSPLTRQPLPGRPLRVSDVRTAEPSPYASVSDQIRQLSARLQSRTSA